MCHCHLDTARNDIDNLARYAQLVVPFHQLAHHPGLVEHFLRPMDWAGTRAERAFLGNRRTAGGKDERYWAAREVWEVIYCVGGTDIDVHHHRLRTAIHQIGAMRHGHREVFVWHQNGLRHLGIGFFCAAERFHNWGKVGTGIGEEIVGTVICERAQKCFGGDCWPLAGRCRRHAFRPQLSAEWSSDCYCWCAVLTDGAEGDNGLPCSPRCRYSLTGDCGRPGPKMTECIYSAAIPSAGPSISARHLARLSPS